MTAGRVLVTGATGGIGGAIAKALHAQGAKVAISGTRREVLDTLAAELGGVDIDMNEFGDGKIPGISRQP